MYKHKIDELVGKIESFYNDTMSEITRTAKTKGNGGQVRKQRGDMVEYIVKMIWSGLNEFKENTLLESFTGKDKIIQVKSKTGIVKKHQTDCHNFLNGELVNVVECKAYLDSCYYERACCDMVCFKKHNSNIHCIVVAIENSLNENTMKFYDDMFDNAVDKVYFLTDGKRSSTKPIYQEKHFKPLCKNKIETLIRDLLKLMLKISEMEEMVQMVEKHSI